MRLLGGFIIIVLFTAWVIYRLLKKDLRNYMMEFYSGIAFVLAWAVLYYFVFS